MTFSRSFRSISGLSAGLAVLVSTLLCTGEEAAKGKDKDKDTAAAAPAPAAASAAKATEELSTQGKEMLAAATDLSKEITAAIEGWLKSGGLSQEKLFSYLYYPIADTDPTKYSTDWDGLADRDFAPILEKYLAKSSMINFAVALDKNGYLPTHNRQFSQPLTGNRAVDLVQNRTKRIFGDQVGFRAARNTKPYLLQSYARDTGEMIADISVPVFIAGKHWGAVRIGYRVVDH